MSEENQQEKKAIHIKPKADHRNGGQKNFRRYDGGNRKRFNNKSRKVTVSPEFEKLKQDGIVIDMLLGAKTVFATNKLNYSQLNELNTALKEQDDPTHNWYNKSQSKNGWLAVSAFTEEGRGATSVLSDAIEVFDKFAEDDKDVFRINYGEAALSVDFTKANLCSFEDGTIIYPYGVFFFSDVSSNGQFGASVAVIRDRYVKIRSKGSILPITADNWNNSQLFGSFNHSGHFVIFFASEEIEKAPEVYNPVVTTIDIEVFANKDNNGVNQTAVGRVVTNSVCVEDMIEYLTKKVFSRHVRSTNSFVAERFLKDYIYSIGLNPNNYNLDVNDTSSNGVGDADFKFKSNFGANANGKKRSESSGTKSSSTATIVDDARGVNETIDETAEGVSVEDDLDDDKLSDVDVVESDAPVSDTKNGEATPDTNVDGVENTNEESNETSAAPVDAAQ